MHKIVPTTVLVVEESVLSRPVAPQKVPRPVWCDNPTVFPGSGK